MTRDEILLRVRDGIGEPVDVSIASAGYWSDAELYRYINDGIVAMCEVRGIEDVVRAVIDDESRIPVPSDPIQMTYIDQIFLYSLTGTVTYAETAPVAPVSGDSWVVPSTFVLSQYSGTGWTVADMPKRTDLERSIDSIEDKYIKFTSKQSGLLELVGYRVPNEFSTIPPLTSGSPSVGYLSAFDTIECEIPAPFDLGVVEYALYKAASKDENRPKLEEHLANFLKAQRMWGARRSYKRSRFVDRWYA